MLGRAIKLFWPFFLVALFLFGLFIWTEEKFSRTFCHCINEWGTKYAANQPNHEGLIVAKIFTIHGLCLIKAIDGHSGFFSVVATTVIALFTYTLYVATRGLGQADERNFRAVQRAFVSLDGFEVELFTGADTDRDMRHIPDMFRATPELYITRFAVFPKWRNGGSTPTKNMMVQVNWKYLPNMAMPGYIYSDAPTRMFVAPHATEIGREIVIPDVNTLIFWALNPTGEEPRILIWGRADYEDVFKRQHFLEWSRRISFHKRPGERLTALFIQWGDHNRTDDG
jgi:hypothetical protein